MKDKLIDEWDEILEEVLFGCIDIFRIGRRSDGGDVIFTEVFEHDVELLCKGKLNLSEVMGKIEISEGRGRWIGRHSIGIIGLQEDGICEIFDLIDVLLLSVVIHYEGEWFGEYFEDDSIGKRIGVGVWLSKYRGQNCICLDQYHIPCWWRRGWNSCLFEWYLGTVV